MGNSINEAIEYETEQSNVKNKIAELHLLLELLSSFLISQFFPVLPQPSFLFTLYFLPENLLSNSY